MFFLANHSYLLWITFVKYCYCGYQTLYMYVYPSNTILYNLIFDGPFITKNILKIILVFKHPLKQSKKANMLQKKMRYSHLDGCYFSPYSSSTPWQWSCIDMLSTRLYFWLVFRRIFYQNGKDWISARSYMLSVYYQTIFIWSNIYILSG